MISMAIYNFARGQGVEPRLPGPKPGVLPLDDPRKFNLHTPAPLKRGIYNDYKF